LLISVGLGLFGVGVFATSEPAGTGLIIVGTGIACLGVLLPIVREAQIGTGGFTFKTVASTPDEPFALFSQHELDHVQRLALFMTGDRQRAMELSSDALARAYANWHAMRALDPTRYVVCVVTRLALAAQILRLVAIDPMLPNDRSGLEASLKTLLSIPPRPRAVALLHYYEGLSDREIAEILGESTESVHGRLQAAEAQLAATTDASAAPEP
jgi:DNA-directed RNA polymerase specialized sigma24 family protein